MSPRLVVGVGMVGLGGAVALSVDAQTTGIREVTASSHSVIPIQARLRYTTLVLLPEGEDILDVSCGDKDFWVISATHNLAFIKPAKEGASTNLNLVTTSGIVYSFLLTERAGPSVPDLKVYITADPEAAHSATKYYTAEQVDEIRAEVTAEKTRADAAARDASTAVTTYQRSYPTLLQFPYGPPHYAKPFLVRAIWHDGRFTYIKSDAPERPVLYELTDGTPALVSFEVRGGTYVVPKVLQAGYLALGKARFPFAQQER